MDCGTHIIHVMHVYNLWGSKSDGPIELRAQQHGLNWIWIDSVQMMQNEFLFDRPAISTR
jgi:hypothetical protein